MKTRASSPPLHVHVDESTPVHVHVKKSQRTSPSKAAQVSIVIYSSGSQTGVSLKLPVVVGTSDLQYGVYDSELETSMKIREAKLKKETGNLRATAKVKTRIPWIPPGKASVRDAAYNWEGPTHRLEITPANDDPAYLAAVLLSQEVAQGPVRGFEGFQLLHKQLLLPGDQVHLGAGHSLLLGNDTGSHSYKPSQTAGLGNTPGMEIRLP
ncbi:UNVERIFIED_CONTAM: hypothetical protein FKN15_001594 [Acipenser sinensis]